MLCSLLFFISGMTFCLAFFVIGYKCGARGGEGRAFIELPKIKMPSERKQLKANKKELDRINRILENINNFDGTGANQREIE